MKFLSGLVAGLIVAGSLAFAVGDQIKPPSIRIENGGIAPDRYEIINGLPFSDKPMYLNAVCKDMDEALALLREIRDIANE